MPSAQIRIHLGGNDRASQAFMRVTHPDGEWTEYHLTGSAGTNALLLIDEPGRQARAALCHADIGGPVQPLSIVEYRTLMASTRYPA
ncbi:hypothetical protein [Herbaspirillum autotrophicum]|uniref:hypothetical protein n=1 Tax=Herbaspirillum autotrophicum TaxID=180195 RepID=UPI00067E4F16|nr:hypothetical protein [Herbaspirillum autotrophicum]